MNFVDKVLNDPQFLQDFLPFQERISFYGKWNSLSQTILKLTLPGVPDIYQGTELWDLSLVDPDNRRPVDFNLRKQILQNLKTQKANSSAKEGNLLSVINSLLENTTDGRIKLFVIHQLLLLRKYRGGFFTEGSYEPLPVEGEQANRVIAFARKFEGERLIIAVARFFTSMEADSTQRRFTGSPWKSNTAIQVGENTKFTDVLTGITYEPKNGALPLSDVFKHLPFCVLESLQTNVGRK